MKNYYHLTVARLDVDATWEKDDRWPTVKDKETGAGWYLDGLATRPLSTADMHSMLAEWGQTETAAWIDVEDNGSGGDGLWMRIVPAARARMKHGDDPDALVAVRLTPEQARILAAALQAAAGMREAEDSNTGGTTP